VGRRGKTEKVSVTLTEELAGEIRSMVSRGEVSSFFAEALEHYMAYRKQRIALEKGFGAWRDEDHPDLATPLDRRTSSTMPMPFSTRPPTAPATPSS